MRLVLRRLVPALFAMGCAAAADVPRTVIVVRHAERAGGTGADVGISDTGRCRAEGLATMLAGANVTAIFTSEVARTQQTAEPLAKRLHLQPEIVAAKEVPVLLTKLRARPAGSVSLVVGHSNTVPQIVESLGAGAVPAIADTEFDRLYIVTLTGKRTADAVMLRYPGCAQQ